jgi:hypothetical protein
MAVTAHAYGNAALKALNKEIDFDTDTVKVMLCTSAYTPNQASHVTTLDAADVTWATSTITARYAVIYESTGTDATSALIAYVDFGADVVSSGGNFTITWDVAGIVTLTAA